MSRKYSPFAGLDARERQERWLEYQNTRMPYIQGAMDMEEEPAQQPVAERSAAKDAQRVPAQSSIPSSAPTAAYAMQQHPQRPTSPAQRMRNPSEPVYASQPPQQQQQQQPQTRAPQPNTPSWSQDDTQAAQAMKVVRHRQYDAVIRKMMDAEKQAKSFQDWSPRV